MLEVIVTKMCLIKVSPKISQGFLQTAWKFILSFFYWPFYHKNQVHGSHHAPSGIFQKSHNFSFSYLHMELGSGLIFENTSTLANFNSRIKLDFTKRNVFANYTPSKRNTRKTIPWWYCEHQIYVSCKLIDMQNVTKPWSNSCLQNWKVASEKRFQQDLTSINF